MFTHNKPTNKLILSLGLGIKKRNSERRMTTVEPSMLNIKIAKITNPNLSRNSANPFFFFDIIFL